MLAAALIALVAVTCGCRQLEARDNLSKGIRAFKATKYADAVDYFKKAVDLQPDFRRRPSVPGHGLSEPVYSRSGFA